MSHIELLHKDQKLNISEESGRYFRYIAEFVGFTADDAEVIRKTKPIIAKHVQEIVDKFYEHVLRYPPTRRVFLKPDGTIDQQYLELRMRHQANFWLRAADGVFDDEFASYLDYVGRAHTSRGADPNIYIAERYVIGQVGFISHAINVAITKELRNVDEDFEDRAVDSWNKLMMLVLEMLARAYGHERDEEKYEPQVAVDTAAVSALAEDAVQVEIDKDKDVPRREVHVGSVDEIDDGERRLLRVGILSIGVFHHKGKWYALCNQCLHRGGPVATGTVAGDIITCPWHGFQYDITTGRMLTDPSARLDTYPVVIRDGEIYLMIPVEQVPDKAE